MKALVTNAADEKQVHKAGEHEKSQRLRELRDVSAIMQTPEGRRFFWRLLHEVCGIRNNPFNHSGSMQNLNIGQQQVGRVIENDLYEASIKLVRLMEDEHFQVNDEGENT